MLGGMLDGLATAAILDTGASGNVLSGPTAQRYAVASERGARYVEVGMTGEHAMGVSRPYTIALCADDGHDGGARRKRGSARRGAGCEAALLLRSQRMLLNEPGADLMTLLTSPGLASDVIGMPAISEAVIELSAATRGMAPVAVAIHPRSARVPADVWVPLTMVDFNRTRHPRNQGPLPSLDVNPMIGDVRARAGARTATGDWLLDTGSAITILSSHLANDLGLVDGRGKPTRAPDFSLPVGGISGGQKSLPGFQIDAIELTAESGTTVVLERPWVLVHDVVTTTNDGDEVRLDGILGMNVLGGSGSGMMMTGFAETYAAPFRRVVIDAPRSRLGLTPAR
jgi:hypothetical protein